MSLCSLLLSLETPNAVRSEVLQSRNIKATSEGSDQTARMRKLVGAFAGCTYHIAGNLMLRLIFFCRIMLKPNWLISMPPSLMILDKKFQKSIFISNDQVMQQTRKS